MNQIILQAKNISKKYGRQSILNNVSFNISQNECIAFVGSNGCGKSTLLRIVSGITKADSGSIWKREPLKMSFIPDHFEKANMPGRKFMQNILEIHGRKHCTTLLKKYYSLFQLDDVIDTPMKYLSKGSLQKIAAIQAILTEVDLLFMDEPLSGQDVMSKVYFVRQLMAKKGEGMSIIMSCHEKELMEEVADSIYQIKNGVLNDGADYLYHNAKQVGLFILDSDHWDMVKQLQVKGYFLSVHIIGKKCRLTISLEKSKEFMYLCLENNLTILKYEEVDQL